MLGFIYYLQNPVTKEIFYVGATQSSLTNRLRTHYQHLREFERGIRKVNKRYEYLQNLRPYKANIVLLEIVEDNVFKREQHYIELFRSLYPNLTNQTDGGRGGDTFKYQTSENQKLIGSKISSKHKGIAKPEGFAENMAKARKGINNPAAGRSKVGWIVAFKRDIPIRMFKFGFEVNSFISNKHAYGNVARAVQGKPNHSKTPYGYTWQFFTICKKEIQDIVEAQYESMGRSAGVDFQ